MELDAKIYIKTPPNWDPRKSEGWDGVGYDPKIGSRFLAGKAGSSIKIHGRKMERTWTLLAQNSNGWSRNKKFIININPHVPDRFTPSRARCAENCGSALNHPFFGKKGIFIYKMMRIKVG